MMTTLKQTTFGGGLVAATLAAMLFAGATEAHAAVLNPIGVSGFNVDAVVEANATTSGGDLTNAADPLDFGNGNGWTLFEQGFNTNNTSAGMPSSGQIQVTTGSNTLNFQLGDYGNNQGLVNNALGVGGRDGEPGERPEPGTLTLNTPQALTELAILAFSVNGGGDPDLTINFTDGSSLQTTYFAPDWFNVNDNVALNVGGRVKASSSGSFQNVGSSNPRLYYTLIELTGEDATKAIESLTFGKAGDSSKIFAIAGVPEPASVALLGLGGAMLLGRRRQA